MKETSLVTIQELLSELDRFEDRIPLELLTQRLEQLDISTDDVRQAVQFGSERYQRNLLHEGPAYQALILCWRAGQRSPIHDHRGSSCGVRVIEGVATETVFDRTAEGLIFATHSRELPCGGSCGSQDTDIHQVSNLQPEGRDLVTLHIYFPALLCMGMYSLTQPNVSEFRDPVIGFVGGDGI